MWIFIFHFRWKHSVHESLPSAAHSNSKHQNFTPDSAQVHVHNFNIFSPARTYDKWKHWIYAADARNRVFHIILQPTASESLPHEDCVEERKKKHREKGQSSGNRSAARFLQLWVFFFTLLSCKLSFTKHHCNCHVFTSLHAFRVSIQLPKHFTSESLITSLQAVSRHGAALTGDFISTSQRSSS